MAEGRRWLSDKLGGVAVGESAKYLWGALGAATPTILQCLNAWRLGDTNTAPLIIGFGTTSLLVVGAVLVSLIHKKEKPQEVVKGKTFQNQEVVLDEKPLLSKLAFEHVGEVSDKIWLKLEERGGTCVRF